MESAKPFPTDPAPDPQQPMSREAAFHEALALLEAQRRAAERPAWTHEERAEVRQKLELVVCGYCPGVEMVPLHERRAHIEATIRALRRCWLPEEALERLEKLPYEIIETFELEPDLFPSMAQEPERAADQLERHLEALERAKGLGWLQCNQGRPPPGRPQDMNVRMLLAGAMEIHQEQTGQLPSSSPSNRARSFLEAVCQAAGCPPRSLSNMIADVRHALLKDEVEGEERRARRRRSKIVNFEECGAVREEAPPPA
ncbi:hypothetical protein NON00_02510 [Roseomonas sp. GC11]|uniref:hypothetical protein n=1 Tax=Roseomonas sp. GC11 TaxID=2950546 RepID=UPI00210DA204|nr:hypothetical protein [Roseomonas sp. GC11]MCQ4158799.1 hypothetical protein [Roseomonas sp. GC11]